MENTSFKYFFVLSSKFESTTGSHTLKGLRNCFSVYTNSYTNSWRAECNDYHRIEWNSRSEFKSWTKLFVFDFPNELRKDIHPSVLSVVHCRTG